MLEVYLGEVQQAFRGFLIVALEAVRLHERRDFIAKQIIAARSGAGDTEQNE